MPRCHPGEADRPLEQSLPELELSILDQPASRAVCSLRRRWYAPYESVFVCRLHGKGSCAVGFTLAKSRPVAARIMELSNDLSSIAAQRAVNDRDFVLAGLKEVATNKAEKSTSARAYELLGKGLGMFRDAIDHTVKNLHPDPSKWTREQLEQVIAAFEREHLEAAAVETRSGGSGSADTGTVQ